MNEEYRVGRTSLQMEIDFNEKVKDTDDEYSKSDQLNVGYFYLQLIYEKLRVGDFFKLVTRKRKITYDCNRSTASWYMGEFWIHVPNMEPGIIWILTLRSRILIITIS